MKKLLEYKYIIIIIILMLSFVFYWFSYKPQQIRKNCYIQALKDFNSSVSYSIGKSANSVIDDYYTSCLRLKGFYKD